MTNLHTGETLETMPPEESDHTQMLFSVSIEPCGCAIFFDDKPEQTPNKTICHTHTQAHIQPQSGFSRYQNIYLLGVEFDWILRCLSKCADVSLLSSPPSSLWTSVTLVKWEPPHLQLQWYLATNPFILPQQDPEKCTGTLGCCRHSNLFRLQKLHPWRNCFKGSDPRMCLWEIQNQNPHTDKIQSDWC